MMFTASSPLTVVSTSPADDSMDVGIESNIGITFNRDISKGVGNFYLHKADGTLHQTFDVETTFADDNTSDIVGLSGGTVAFNPTKDLAQGTGYYVLADAGALTDACGYTWAGITDTTVFNFNTGSSTALVSTTPSDDATDIGITPTISLTFNTDIQAGTGNISVFDSNDVLHQAFDVTTLSITGQTVQFDITTDLDDQFGYYVTVDATAIQDTLESYPFDGFSDSTTFNFTTNARPVYVSHDITPTTTDLTGWELVITYNEPISANVGDIVLYDETSTVIQTIDITTATIVGSTVTVQLTIPMSGVIADTVYNVEIDGGALIDTDGFTTDALTGSVITFAANLYFNATLDAVVGSNVTLYNTGEMFVDWGNGVNIAYESGDNPTVATLGPTVYITCLDLIGQTPLSNLRFAGTGITAIDLIEFKFYSMHSMFKGLTSLVSVNFNPLNSYPIYDMTEAFMECTSLTTITGLNTSATTSFNTTFHRCSALTSIPLLDTSSATTMRMAFRESGLTTIPLLDTSSVTDMSYAFTDCTSLTTMPLIDTSSVTTLYDTWSGCTALTTVPAFDVSSVTLFYSAWDGCTSLTYMPYLNTASATGNSAFGRMFYGCTSLVCLTALNTTQASSIGINVFTNCPLLVQPDAWWQNTLTAGSGANWSNNNPCP